MRRRHPFTPAFGLAPILAALIVAALIVAAGSGDGPLRAQAVATAPERAASEAATGAYDAAFLGGLKWRSLGPARGGRSIAVAGHPDRPLEYYFGATGGGLWKTTNGGTTWTPVADAFLKTSSVGAVAVAPSNGDVVYVGMGEVQLRGNVIQGDGVYRTTDAGKTWTHVGLEKTMAVARIRVHPANPDVVWVAALGHPYGPNAERGVFRSTDGGKTWARTLFRDEKTGAVDLALDPTNPDVLYAGMWEVFRTPHSLSSGGPGSGLFKSTDGGVTWIELTRKPGLPTGMVGKVGVSVSGADPKRVYAIVEAEDGGVFASDDAGATWKNVSTDRRLRQRAFYYTRIYADPKEKDLVYVLNVGFFRSTDGGKTYRTIRVPHGDNHDLWIAPGDPKRMIQSNDGGANVSFDGGATWTDQDIPTAQFYNVFTTSHTPYHVCGAQQDNSTACLSSAAAATGPGGLSAGNPLYAVGGGESGYIAPHPTNTNVFFAGSYGGTLTRFDRATGTSRAINIWPENPMGHSAKDIKERFQWTFPIVFSPHDPKVLYASSQHLWRTLDEGQSWERISPDLTRADPATLGPSGGPITLDQTGVETYATVFTVAPSRLERDVIWTGSDDGVVHVTRDAGRSWQKVTPPDLSEFTRISLIEASPHKAGTAYLAGNRYQRGDRGPHVFRTDDYGKTWTRIVGGIPGTDFARAIREDIVRPGLLYLGTEHGIYVSFDNGARWQSLRLDLPVTPVHGIVVEDNDLVIGTHGRSFYVLDNISVLRQLGPALTTARVHLFEPGLVQRRVQPAATVDYFLKDEADKVTIEFLDAKGAVIRSYDGVPEKKAKPESAPSAAAEADDEGPGPPPARVSTKAGMNRFRWDLRQKPPRDFKGLIMWAGAVRGPMVLPGTYQVRLTAHGETKTQRLRVDKDPRFPQITDADLQAQHALASDISSKVQTAHEAVLRIRHIRDQAKARADKAGDAQLSASVDAMARRLTEIEGEIYQYRNQSNQDPLNYPIKLNNKLAALQGLVESADGRPTRQAYAVFTELSARLAAQLSALDEAVKRDLAAVNTILAARKLDPVKDEVPSPPAATAAPSAP